MTARAEPVVTSRRTGALRRTFGSIAGRLVLASGAFALLVAVAFALLVATVDELRAANAREARAKEVIVSVLSLERLVADLDTGIRSYAIGGERQFLRPFQTARKVPSSSGEGWPARWWAWAIDVSRRVRVETLSTSAWSVR